MYENTLPIKTNIFENTKIEFFRKKYFPSFKEKNCHMPQSIKEGDLF